MGNVNIFHDALSFNTKEGGGNGGLSIHANGAGGGGYQFDSFYINAFGNYETAQGEYVISVVDGREVMTIPGFKGEPEFLTITALESGFGSKQCSHIYTTYERTNSAAAIHKKVMAYYGITSSNARASVLYDYDDETVDKKMAYDDTTKTLTIKAPLGTSNGYGFKKTFWVVSYFYK